MTQTPVRPARSTSAAAAARRAPRRSKAPWIVAGVLAVAAAAGGAYALSSDDAEPAAQPTAAAPVAAKPTGTEGTFTATVTGTECGVTTVGPDDLAQRPTGQYCLVQLEVRNTGTEARLLDTGAQRALDARGGTHTVAEQAAVFLNDKQPSLLDEIPPGATVRGVLPFDVPKDAPLSAYLLHDSLGSEGARVPLS